jgi:hypothetical protein
LICKAKSQPKPVGFLLLSVVFGYLAISRGQPFGFGQTLLRGNIFPINTF